MKICPQCQRQYEDDMLFCLDDGKSLIPMQSMSPPPTILASSPRYTDEQSSRLGTTQPFTPNSQTVQPPKKSNAWVWVLAIVLGIMLICGGGFIGFLILIAAISPDDNANTSVNTITNTRTRADYSQKFPNVLSDDLSTWEPLQKTQGTDVTYSGKELVITAKPDYFYVLVTSKANFRTENSLTRVTVRNITGGLANYGYGLLIHADQKKPLQRGYIFAIETTTRMYIIGKLQKGQMTNIVDWTQSDAIKPGTESNLLEVIDENGKMSFYVNGELLTELTGYKDGDETRSGVVGLYTSENVPIAFSNLEIRKK